MPDDFVEDDGFQADDFAPDEGPVKPATVRASPVVTPAPARPPIERPNAPVVMGNAQMPDAGMQVADPRWGSGKVQPRISADLHDESQAMASLKEDGRRIKKFVGETVPQAASALWDAQSQVGGYLTSDDALSIPIPGEADYPTARAIDAWSQNPMELLKAVGHGIAPQTVPAPGTLQVTQPFMEQTPGSRPMGMVETLSAYKDKLMSPAVEAIQAGQKTIGKPIVDALAKVPGQYASGSPFAEGIVDDPNPTKDAVVELAMRQGGRMLTGEEPNPDAPYALKATNALGPATVPAMGVMEAVGQAPFFLLSTGMGAKAVSAERAAIMRSAKLTNPTATAAALAPTVVKEAAIEGFAQGAVQAALTPGADVLLGPAAMGILGTLGGKALAKPASQSMTMQTHAALMPAQTWDSFLKDIDKLVTDVRPLVYRAKPRDVTGSMPEAVRLGRESSRASMAVGGMSPKTTKLVLDTATGRVRNSPLVNAKGTKQGATNIRRAKGADKFDSTMAVHARNEDGQQVGREVQVAFREPGKVDITYRDTPLNTPKDVRRWEAMVRKDGVTLTGSYAEGVAGDMAKVEAGVNEMFSRSDVTPEYSPPEIAMLTPAVRNKVLLEKDLKLIAEDRAKVAAGGETSEAFGAVTAPGKRAQGLPVVLGVNDQGVAKALQVNDVPSKPKGTWRVAVGDLVMDANNTPLVVQGFTLDGKVKARMPGARGPARVVPNESLKFIADKEGQALGAFGPSKAPAIGVPDATYTPGIDSTRANAVAHELKAVTVSRMAQALNTDPGTAGMLIDRMLSEGVIDATSVPGVFRTRDRAMPSSYGEALREAGALRHEPWGELPLDPYTYRGIEYFSRAPGPAKFPPAKVPGLDDPVQPGLEVWFGHSRHGRPMKGVLRGPDPSKPKHYLLDVWSESSLAKLEADDALKALTLGDGSTVKGTDRLHTVSVPLEKLRTVIPVNYAKPALQKLFQNRGLYGLTTPHPPNFVVASSTFQQQVANAVKLAQANRIPEGIRSKADALQGQLLNAYYRTPTPLRRMASRLYAAWPTARDSMLRISERVKDATGGYGNQADQDLINVMESAHETGQHDDALKGWLSNNPRALDSMRTLRDLLNERKLNSQWMADRKLSSIDMLEQARGAGEEPEYLTMMYNVDVLKGKYDQWVKKNAPQLWDNAVAELTRGGRNPAQVENELASILRQRDSIKALGESSLVDNTAFGKLLDRGQWQKKYPAIAQLMGPVPSAPLRLGHTIGYQRAIKANVETWDAIAASGWWSHGPREDLQLQIPNEPRFGNAAGGYTHESLRNFVVQKPEDAAGSFARMAGWAGGKWKSFHTVYGGPAPWVNNVLRNLKGVALSGAFQNPAEDMEGFVRAPELLLAWRDNPSMLGPAALVGEAKQFTALSSGFAGAEIFDARKRIQDELLRTMTRAAGKATTLEDMVMAAQDFMRTRTENIKDAYDAIDQYFKMASYINLRKRYVGQGASVHDAAARAAEDINASYPNFELTAPLVERNRGKFGWVAPFLSSKAEDMRINAMTMARIGRTMNPAGDPMMRDPGLILRLAAFSATAAGAMGTMRALARANGITAQDETDGKNLLTMKQQSWSPAVIPMWDLDDQGRMQFIDLTPIEDATMMLRGDPRDPVLARIALNNVQDLVGDDTYLGRGAHSFGQWTGAISTPPQQSSSPAVGEAGVLGLLGDYARSGGIPQAPLRMMDAYARTQPQPNNPTWEQWSGPQALAKGLGLPYAGPAGLPTMVRSLKEAKGEVRKLKNEARQIPRKLGDGDQERFDYLLDSKVRGLGAVQDRIQDVRVPRTLSGKPQPGGKK